jgi:hypothetical protein
VGGVKQDFHSNEGGHDVQNMVIIL